MMTDRPKLTATILSLCAARGEGKSICPSEVARALAGNDEKQWRLLMHAIREAALALAREGSITILRKGKPAETGTMPKGVIRLRIGPS
jgi:hypothetical protein